MPCERWGCLLQGVSGAAGSGWHVPCPLWGRKCWHVRSSECWSSARRCKAEPTHAAHRFVLAVLALVYSWYQNLRCAVVPASLYIKARLGACALLDDHCT